MRTVAAWYSGQPSSECLQKVQTHIYHGIRYPQWVLRALIGDPQTK